MDPPAGPGSFDVEDYGIPLSESAVNVPEGVNTKVPRPRRGEPYLGGPIPLSWVAAAMLLPDRTWRVASALWFVGIRSRGKSATVVLTLKTLRRFNLHRRDVSRALRHLEGAGLVRVDRAAGRRSLVTILPAPDVLPGAV